MVFMEKNFSQSKPEYFHILGSKESFLPQPFAFYLVPKLHYECFLSGLMDSTEVTAGGRHAVPKVQWNPLVGKSQFDES
jgi:hypothetical protein